MSEQATEQEHLGTTVYGHGEQWWLDQFWNALVTHHSSGWDSDNAMTADAIIEEVCSQHGFEVPRGDVNEDWIGALAFRAMGLDEEHEIYEAEKRSRGEL